MLREALGCPEPVAAVLASRGVQAAYLSGFFEPNLGDLHDPESMLGMEAAAGRIEQAVLAREPILIYGDYDVDGTTATVLLKTCIDRLSPAGETSLVTWHVPHRIREGYGMQGSRLAEAAMAGVRLVISVDTGIRAFAAAAEAKALGLDLIVTDHHLPEDSCVPEAVAVLNPQQPGCGYPFKQLCGAAVAFKLAHALLLRAARKQADAAGALEFLQGAAGAFAAEAGCDCDDCGLGAADRREPDDCDAWVARAGEAGAAGVAGVDGGGGPAARPGAVGLGCGVSAEPADQRGGPHGRCG